MIDVLVVGAGLTGLAAALEVARMGAGALVFEGERRPGGVVQTERVDGGWIVEAGPDSFLTGTGGVTALAAELGIAHRITPLATSGSGLWTGTALRPLSEGEAAALLGIQAKSDDLSTAHASFSAGMGELVEALVGRVGASLRSCAEVLAIALEHGRIIVTTSDGGSERVGALVLAVPAWRAAELLAPLSPVAADVARSIQYLPSLTVSLAYRADQMTLPLSGTGFVVQADAAPPVRACTFASHKFAGRAPRDHVLLRAFLAPTNERPEAAAHRVLAHVLRIEGPPLWHRVHHWPRGLPYYGADHEQRVERARRALATLGPIALAGAGYDGAGVSACLASGARAARALLGATP